MDQNDQHNQRHLTDDEIQQVVESTAAATAASRHLGSCRDCAARVDAHRALFEFLAAAEPHPDPAGLESAVMGRLFPRRVRRRIPAWLPPAAAAVLTISTAVTLDGIRLFGAAAGAVIESALAGKVSTLLAPVVLFEKSGLLLRKVADQIVALAAMWETGSAALIHIVKAPEIQFSIAAAAVIYSMVALGWGTRLILARTRGGIHNVLLG